MFRCKPILFSSTLTAVLLAISLITPSAGIASVTSSAASHCGSWQVVPSPNIGSNTNILNKVAALSANDVWAVGDYFGTRTQSTKTLIEHWNGAKWQVVNSPNVGAYLNYLNGVAVVSARDVWAVGYSQSVNTAPFQTLIEHWNGSTWSVVPSPSPGYSDTLSAVSASSSDSIWAVGESYPTLSGNEKTLIERWNGSAWQVITSPSPGNNYNLLSGVTAISASAVWAVGWSNVQAFSQTLIERWDGSSWNVVKSPSPGADGTLFGVAAASAHDVWTVGNKVPGNYFALAEQWNGSRWRVIKTPHVGTDNSLLAVGVISASNIWAVGDQGDTVQGTSQTLIQHWNGKSWQIVPSPSPGATNSDLAGVAAVSASQVWAVGDSSNDGQIFKTLIEFYC